MIVLRDVGAYDLGPCALAIGKFDGVHIGHQALLTRVREAADELGVRAVALTFDRSPQGAAELSGEREKIARIEALGMDALIITKFSQEIRDTPANLYLEMLCELLQPRVIACGQDFRFGKGAEGDVSLLMSLQHALGYRLLLVSKVALGGEVVSSTGIRDALARGEADKATQMLGLAGEITTDKKQT